MEQMRQAKPDSGLDFQVKSLKPLKVFPLRSEAVRGKWLPLFASVPAIPQGVGGGERERESESESESGSAHVEGS